MTQRLLRSLIAKATDDAKTAQNQSLLNTVSTFAGEESSVPNYAGHLLSEIAEMNVLYLKERRKPIGKEEARQLLSLKVRRGGTEVLRHIQENVTDLLGVQIDAFEGHPTSRRGEATAELDVDNFLIEVNGSAVSFREE